MASNFPPFLLQFRPAEKCKWSRRTSKGRCAAVTLVLWARCTFSYFCFAARNEFMNGDLCSVSYKLWKCGRARAVAFLSFLGGSQSSISPASVSAFVNKYARTSHMCVRFWNDTLPHCLTWNFETVRARETHQPRIITTFQTTALWWCGNHFLALLHFASLRIKSRQNIQTC